MKKQYTVRIIYQDKQTGHKHTVTFRYAINEEHAMKIARKLRPKNSKILLVYMAASIALTESETPKP